MSWRMFLYGAWCLAIVTGFMGASAFGYSPFADGGRTPFHGSGGGIYGPMHK